MPAPSSTIDNDLARGKSASRAISTYGVVGYTHAGGIDRPIGVTRMSSGGIYAAFYPQTNWRGQYNLATQVDGTQLQSGIAWPGRIGSAYLGATPRPDPYEWFGGLLVEQVDASGLMYRRNRYYDPKSGRFTQPDPIGIAGGLNAYGFGGGDPVSYSDPFGLCPEDKPLCQWLKAGLMAAGTDIGGMLGGGAGLLAGPGAIVASPAGAITGMALGAGAGLAAGELVDRMFFSSSDPVRGGKSSDEYDNHINNKSQAEQRLEQLQERLSNTKGPKAQRPIQEQIDRLQREIRGHEKEIRQKWPDGRPE